MQNNEIIKLNGVEFYKEDLQNAFSEGKRFLVHGFSIYQIFYSVAQKQFYTHRVYHQNGRLVGRGRFVLYDAKQANHLIDLELFV